VRLGGWSVSDNSNGCNVMVQRKENRGVGGEGGQDERGLQKIYSYKNTKKRKKSTEREEGIGRKKTRVRATKKIKG